MKILLIAGGWSSERDISLLGARGIQKALTERGHSVTFFDLLEGFDRLLVTAVGHDFAFINLHGAPGEDGLVQALLERVGCPYQGSGPAGSFLALNKAAAKQVFRQAGLPTADWCLLVRRPDPAWEPPFGWPVFVKSNTGGSSLRLGRAASRAELDTVLEDILATGDCAIVEPRLAGRDVTCGVLGQEALAPILILPEAGDFFEWRRP